MRTPRSHRKSIRDSFPTAHANAGFERDGQGLLLQNTTLSLSHAARERKLTLDRRMQKVVELIKVTLPEQVIVWCELDEEQRLTDVANDIDRS